MYDSQFGKKDDESLKDVLKGLKESIEGIDSNKKKAPKKFRLPMKAKVTKQRQKDNYATILKINENGSVDFIKEKIEDQTIVVDGIPRLATAGYVLNYKGKPLIVQPSWSLKPFSPNDEYKNSLKDGSNNVGMSLLLAKMKSGAIAAKKKFNMGLGIGLLVLVGIIIYAISSH